VHNGSARQTRMGGMSWQGPGHGSSSESSPPLRSRPTVRQPRRRRRKRRTRSCDACVMRCLTPPVMTRTHSGLRSTSSKRRWSVSLRMWRSSPSRSLWRATSFRCRNSYKEAQVEDALKAVAAMEPPRLIINEGDYPPYKRPLA
jgi:hypothetical protein